jgi:hypothetical protein
MNFKCRICDKTFKEIPPDAFRMGRGVSPLYRFANGEVHVLTGVRVGRHTGMKDAGKTAREKENESVSKR